MAPNRNPWWWTFTDVELSMIASHLAAGGSFCCKANAGARGAVTSNRRKQDLLAEHAYEGWGCYGDDKGERGTGSSSFAGQGPYGWVTPGLTHTEADTAHKRDHELLRAAHYFESFLEEISPRPVIITMDAYLKAKRNAENTFKNIDALTRVLKFLRPPVN